MAEPSLHEGPCGGLDRLAGGIQHVAYNGWHDLVDKGRRDAPGRRNDCGTPQDALASPTTCLAFAPGNGVLTASALTLEESLPSGPRGLKRIGCLSTIGLD